MQHYYGRLLAAVCWDTSNFTDNIVAVGENTRYFGGIDFII